MWRVRRVHTKATTPVCRVVSTRTAWQVVTQWTIVSVTLQYVSNLCTPTNVWVRVKFLQCLVRHAKRVNSKHWHQLLATRKSVWHVQLTHIKILSDRRLATTATKPGLMYTKPEQVLCSVNVAGDILLPARPGPVMFDCRVITKQTTAMFCVLSVILVNSYL